MLQFKNKETYYFKFVLFFEELKYHFHLFNKHYILLHKLIVVLRKIKQEAVVTILEQTKTSRYNISRLVHHFNILMNS